MSPGKLPKALAFTALISVAVPNAQADDWIVFAQEGDTLWDLCLKYTNKRGCWIELGKYNAISNDRAILSSRYLVTSIIFRLARRKRCLCSGVKRYISVPGWSARGVPPASRWVPGENC